MPLENPYPTPNPLVEEKHPLLVLVILLGAILSFLMLGSGLLLAFLSSKGYALEDVAGMLTDSSTASDRNLFRTTLMAQHLMMFVLPALATALFIYQGNWRNQLQLAKAPKLNNWGLGILLILSAFPLVQFTYWLNQQLPLPDWALTIESDTQEAILQMLKTESPYELFFNILVVAVIPAIGEELIFRGFIQNKLEKIIASPHVAVWLAAILFSAFHMQFEGFIPRMLLGALLGYLLVWTKNLWVPIIAHFFNNAIQVVAQYLYAEEFSSLDLEQLEEVNYPMSAVSLVLVVYLGHQLWKRNEEKEFLG